MPRVQPPALLGSEAANWPHASSIDESPPIVEGRKHFEAGRFAESLAIIDDALALKPIPELLFARGATLSAWGRWHAALESFRRASDTGLNHVDLDMQLGWTYVNLRRLEEAETHFRKAEAADPDSRAYVALANVLEMRGKLAEHADEFARGLSRWEDDYDAVMLLAVCKLHQKDREGGIAMFRRAISIDPNRSRGWSNLGAALNWNEHLGEALAACQRAFDIDLANGANGDGFINLATVLRENGRRDDARNVLAQGLATNPDTNGQWLYSIMLLEEGTLAEGWLQHEFRWLKEPQLSRRWTVRCPVWSGQELDGKTVLLHAEQGYGDAIQFIRYAPLLKERGARVIFDTHQDFDEISRDFFGVDAVFVSGAIPHFDYHIPLLSLPRVLGTDLASIPAPVPYLKLRPSHIERWAERIPAGGKVKVGLVWAGNPKHLRDGQRSMALTMLETLGQIDGIQLYSLQKGPTAAVDVAASRLSLVDLAPDLHDFCDTAAAISRLDLVISVDTSVAHLAGALAKSVWVMLATPSDWRWLQEGDCTPWYPTMRLFRQQERNQWGPVVEEVERNLRKLVSLGNHDDSEPRRTPNVATRTSHKPSVQNEVVRRIDRPPLSLVTEARYGIVQYLPGAGDFARSLQYYGEYLHSELELLERFIRLGGSILEVGTGIGLNTLFLANAVGPAGHVLAYEPQPLLHQIAFQNVAANRLRNVTLLRRSLGPAREPHSDAASVDNSGAANVDWVDGLRLDKLDWIRVNQGVSLSDILKGAEGTLWRLRPWISFSTQSESELLGSIEAAHDYGYQSRRIDIPLFNARNYNRRTDNIFPARYAFGALCIPEEIDIDIDIDLDACMPLASAT